MIHTDTRFSERVEQAVAEIEKTTDAEIVVVAAERSGTYRDVALTWASLSTISVLVVLVLIPQGVHPYALVPELAAIWFLFGWLFDGRTAVRRLAPTARQVAQVSTAARAEFHREAVHATPNRTGILIYVSATEGRVEVIADVGIEGRIPRGEWASAAQQFRHDDVDHFVAGLARIGEVLAKHVPITHNSAFDLPNAPRIRE